MPLFDYLCVDCGAITEVFIAGSSDVPECSTCGSKTLKKLLSAHSSISGSPRHAMPGPGDTACCGSAPGEAPQCAGPGSCCGRV